MHRLTLFVSDVFADKITKIYFLLYNIIIVFIQLPFLTNYELFIVISSIVICSGVFY